VSPSGGLDGYVKSRLHRDSIPGLSSRYEYRKSLNEEFLAKYFPDDQRKEDEIGGACSPHREDEKCM